MKNLKQIFLFICSLALWFGVVGEVGLANDNNIDDFWTSDLLKNDWPDRTSEIDVDKLSYEAVICNDWQPQLIGGFTIGINPNDQFCYVETSYGDRKQYKYNLKKFLRK